MSDYDPSLVAALAEKMRDPREFKALLDQAAYLAGGHVEEFSCLNSLTPVIAGSSRFCHPEDEEIVAWDCKVTLSFQTRTAAKRVDR